MELRNVFEVPAPIDRAWAFLLDVERVAPCMPGAELTEVVDEKTWKGKVNVKLGPISLSYSGTVVMQERDDEARRVVLKASGTETRGKGTASAVANASMEMTDDGKTRVEISTDLTLSGAAAQLGRGMIGDVAQRLTGEFADCITSRLSSSGGGGSGGSNAAAGSLGSPPGFAEAVSPPRPVKGLRLGFWALFRAIGRSFRRLLSSEKEPQ